MLSVTLKKRWPTFHFQLQANFDGPDVTAIVGTSGSGKSTLIHLMNGLIYPDEGYLYLQDRPLVDTKKGIFIQPQQRQMATIFQDPLLFPHFKVKHNLMYGQKMKYHCRFDEIVTKLNIESLLYRYPHHLSGGEKQRVAIGRALLSDPKLLLMDEPLAALDMPHKKELLSYIKRLSTEFKLPILYVTHHLFEARVLATKLVILNKGQLYYYGDISTGLTLPYFAAWQEY